MPDRRRGLLPAPECSRVVCTAFISALDLLEKQKSVYDDTLVGLRRFTANRDFINHIANVSTNVVQSVRRICLL